MRKNIFWLTIFMATSFALAQSPAFINTNTFFSGLNSQPTNRYALDRLFRFPTRLPRLFISPLMTTYVVTTTADNLDNNSPTLGSLRWAIREANLNPGADAIDFNIPGAGPHTISVGAGLPVITDTVIIDGYSQPGASPNTLATGSDAVLKIEITDTTISQQIALVIGASDCVVQGLVIHGFNHAISIEGNRTNAGASGNVVSGNYIGTNTAGTAVVPIYSSPAFGNLNGGVMIDSGGFKPDGTPGTADNNTIGGTSPAARNVISGNGAFAVRISAATGNLVQGNYIGTNAQGSAALGNGDGITLNASGNTIGGTADGARNVISGNNYNSLFSSGISACCGANDNLIQGNYIGTDATGTVAIPNAVHGVFLNSNANNNTVGGATPAARNLLSGNIQAGVYVASSGNKVQGNYIGTDATGTQALANGFSGVQVSGATNTVGGLAPGEGNVISANARGGIDITSDNVLVQGNFIGTTADGISPLGNAQYGVRVAGANNLIGGGVGNVIAFSRFVPSSDTATGIIIYGGINTTIVGNSIHSNEALGIDLGKDGLTTNDACDFDFNFGTNNNLQNYPVLTSAESGGGTTTIVGTLNSSPSASFTLHFYANTTCDASGYGEGQTYLGSATVNADANCGASFTATLQTTVAGGQVVTATATDPSGNTSEFSACMTVTPSNSAPDSVDDATTTNENTPVMIGVLANDTDPDGDTLTISSFTQGASGSVTNNGDGTLTYTPNAGFSGADSFSYSIGDGHGGADSATVNVTVNRISSPPDAVDDAATTDEDKTATIDARANDSNGNCGAVSVSNFTQGAHGSVVFFNGSFFYAPATNFNGTDSFTYTLRCTAGDTDTATVTVTVNSINDLPRAANDAYQTYEDVVLNIAAPGVLTNDTDADGDALTASLVSGPTRGTLALNADGSFTYTPPLNYSGTATFTYEMSDGNGGTALAVVTITIAPVNDPPIARDDTATTQEERSVGLNVLTNDSDPEGEALTLIGVAQATNGRASINTFTPGQVSYRPNRDFNGEDSFTYTLSDASGNRSTGTVRVTVTPINDAPVVVDDSYVLDGASLTIAAPGILANDTDIDGDPLTVTLVAGPTSGTVTFNADGSFTYTRGADFVGCDSFAYQARDGYPPIDNGVSTVATVSINVSPASGPSASTALPPSGTNSLAVRPITSKTSDRAVKSHHATLSTPSATPFWSSTANLNAARVFHTATLLRDGKVLVVGGTGNAVLNFFTERAFLKSAEIYDPTTGTWQRTGDLRTARGHHTATSLPDGKVLIAGGVGSNGALLKTAEIYDPATGLWTQTRGSLNVARAGHTATLLPTPRSTPGGKVLIAAGVSNGLSVLNSAEIYDQTTGTWTRTRNLTAARWAHTATFLPNGKLLVAGGYGVSGSFVQNTAELYDPTTNTWTRTAGNLSTARGHHTATLLQVSRKVLLAGGLGPRGVLTAAELYDPSSNTFTPTQGRLNTGRWLHTATLLRDGRVLTAGGNGDGNFGLFVTNTAELYDPATDTWTRTANLVAGGHSQIAMLLYNNKVLAAGGMRGGVTINTAELYDALDSRRLFSTCSAVTITAVHGAGFHGNSRIGRIENGKVPCMHAETGETAECLFDTGGVSAGLMWVEAVDGHYAKTGQAITPQGEPGGEWIVAARVDTNGTVPCVAPSGHDTLGAVYEGFELQQTCVIEEANLSINAMSFYPPYGGYMENFTTLEVCSLNHPFATHYNIYGPFIYYHPDNAYLTRTISTCRGLLGCYTGLGAALNDLNGTERDENNGYYLGEPRCHFMVNGSYEVPAAKRPATRSFPAPAVDPYSYILWRPVNPNVNIANDR